MTSEPRQSPPRVGEEWQKNGTDRVVEIESTDNRFAYIRNVRTGYPSRIDLYTFTRQGRTGWTRIKEAPRDDL